MLAGLTRCHVDLFRGQPAFTASRAGETLAFGHGDIINEKD
jgi:hypothetical protein